MGAHSQPLRRRSAGRSALAACVAGVALTGLTGLTGITGLAAAEAADGQLSGTVFQDANRNGVAEQGETALAGMQLYLYDATQVTYFGTTVTDAAGRYSFGSLAAGTYLVRLDPAAWTAWEQDWVPTTTGGDVHPERTVAVSGTAVADFGIRRIVRSTEAGSPVSSHTGPDGLRVESYNDVVTARSLYDDLHAGSLVGPEAATVTVRFDLGPSSATVAGFGQSAGRYTDYAATSTVAYSSFLADGDATLFHEYGHAWALYYAYLTQQDPTLAGYLAARGLAGDSRVGQSYEWSPRELIAEDYRQLFGSTTARAEAQMNRSVAPAAQVPGLADYLRGAFRTAPADSTATGAPALAPPAVSGLAVSPAPVVTVGTVRFDLSSAAAVTVTVVNASGRTVAVLLASAERAAGAVSVGWNRLDAAGRKAKRGTYRAVVSAANLAGASTASVSFPVA